MLWCTEAGFSGQSVDSTGFYVPYKTDAHPAVVFVGESVDDSQLAQKLQTIFDTESMVHFERSQGVEGTLKSLGRASATGLSFDSSKQNPTIETRRDQRTVHSPSMTIDKNESASKQESATDSPSDGLKEAIGENFKNKALWFAVDWSRDHRMLQTQIQANSRVQERNLENTKLRRFVRCAYECQARGDLQIDWGDVIDFVMPK